MGPSPHWSGQHGWDHNEATGGSLRGKRHRKMGSWVEPPKAEYCVYLVVSSLAHISARSTDKRQAAWSALLLTLPLFVRIITGPLTHSVGGQYCFALWRLSSSVVGRRL